MFLARIEGTVVVAVKPSSLDGCRFLVAQRLEADGSAGAEPIAVVDWLIALCATESYSSCRRGCSKAPNSNAEFAQIRRCRSNAWHSADREAR
jgi:microcompartment protein CcmK/EutM